MVLGIFSCPKEFKYSCNVQSKTPYFERKSVGFSVFRIKRQAPVSFRTKTNHYSPPWRQGDIEGWENHTFYTEKFKELRELVRRYLYESLRDTSDISKASFDQQDDSWEARSRCLWVENVSHKYVNGKLLEFLSAEKKLPIFLRWDRFGESCILFLTLEAPL